MLERVIGDNESARLSSIPERLPTTQLASMPLRQQANFDQDTLPQTSFDGRS
jgi:hypothetical protein